MSRSSKNKHFKFTLSYILIMPCNYVCNTSIRSTVTSTKLSDTTKYLGSQKKKKKKNIFFLFEIMFNIAYKCWSIVSWISETDIFKYAFKLLRDVEREMVKIKKKIVNKSGCKCDVGRPWVGGAMICEGRRARKDWGESKNRLSVVHWERSTYV